MSQNFRTVKTREFFTHKWKPNNEDFCFELRKKKRVQLLNQKRFQCSSASPEQPGLTRKDFQDLDSKIAETSETSPENFSESLEELLELTSGLFFINFERFLRIFDLVAAGLQNQSSETTEKRFGFLFSLFLKLDPPLEDELFISKKIFSSLFRDFSVFNDLLFRFLLLVIEKKKLRRLDDYCEFLHQVHNSVRQGWDRWFVLIILELSKNHSICEALSSDLFKLVLDGLVSKDQELQFYSLSIMENIAGGPDSCKSYLVEIGVVNLLSSLLVIGSTSIQSQSIICLMQLLQSETVQLLESVLTDSLISSLLFAMLEKFAPLASPLSKCLYEMTEKSILFNIEILPMLAKSDLFTALRQTLDDYSEFLTCDFLNFLDNILYLSTNSLKMQDFIESGCYFALEHCVLTCNSELSSHIEYMLKSYFEF